VPVAGLKPSLNCGVVSPGQCSGCLQVDHIGLAAALPAPLPAGSDAADYEDLFGLDNDFYLSCHSRCLCRAFDNVLKCSPTCIRRAAPRGASCAEEDLKVLKNGSKSSQELLRSAMSKERQRFYEFGPYRVNPVERVLLRDQQPIPLPPKVFETLLILVQHSERVVLKDDLMKTLWPDTFVEEANLSQNVFVLRKALGESAQNPHYIITVPGRGYRFAEEVKAPSLEDGDLVVQSQSIQTVTIKEESSRVWRRFLGAGVVAILLMGCFGWYWHKRSAGERAGAEGVPMAPARRSVAVLNLQNLSGRAEEKWLATGLSEMLSTELAAGERPSMSGRRRPASTVAQSSGE
jgi:DNA-binding winged helix-turn-helix (wHTH) protein